MNHSLRPVAFMDEDDWLVGFMAKVLFDHSEALIFFHCVMEQELSNCKITTFFTEYWILSTDNLKSNVSATLVLMVLKVVSPYGTWWLFGGREEECDLSTGIGESRSIGTETHWLNWKMNAYPKLHGTWHCSLIHNAFYFGDLTPQGDAESPHERGCKGIGYHNHKWK